ncbi:cytochrome P450 [Phanerochaete sordida]|uniref:Cytochrome P450 n=1 Tax=Phanerochaete sordida TaxID=48140 RepID=A0A9P3LAB2_9APHY|nr:cytochrome P450 [Phanerochaete sordida]
MNLATLAALGVICVLILAQIARRRRPRLPYPPGPPADSVIGHLRTMPDINDAAQVFHEWSQSFGDVISLNTLGKRVVVLCSQEAVTDLLEKRSFKYADRPSFPMYERLGWKDLLVYLPYGPYFRKQRKMLQAPFEKEKVSTYRLVEEQEACVLLYGLLNKPEAMERHVHRYPTAVIMELTYGHRVLSEDDDYLCAAENVAEVLHVGAQASLLDVSPLFEHLPAWFPGAWFVRYIAETRPKVMQRMLNSVSDVQQQLASGEAKQSIVSEQVEALSSEGQLTPENKYDVSMVAYQIFAGGAETSHHTLSTFFACMLLNPEVQRKGHEEIMRVVGSGRLPDFTDRDSLPYVECIVEESQRWHPVLPLGVPHQVMEDDEYRGMHIPKGATVIPNARSITWDERHYHDPRSFKPERFLPKPEGAGETFSQGAVFGWGRRICPGRYLARDMVWIAIARILAVFEVQKAHDAAGNIVEPAIEFVTSLTSHPKPFPYDLRPRSDAAEQLIRQAYDMHMANIVT